MSGPSPGAPTGTNVTPLSSYLGPKGSNNDVDDGTTQPADGWTPGNSTADGENPISEDQERIANDLDGEAANAEFDDDEPRDWAWVEEWRAGGEPVPWGPGLAIGGFALFLVASAVYVLSSGLSDRPLLAIGINVVVAGGLGPALWLSRGLPVLRWIAGGAVVGVLAAWASVLLFLT